MVFFNRKLFSDYIFLFYVIHALFINLGNKNKRLKEKYSKIVNYLNKNINYLNKNIF